MINSIGCNPFLISFTGYHSTMVETVNKAVKDGVATIHCAYSGDVLTTSNKSKATIEHIKPHSVGGADKDFNFLPVKRKNNGDRADIPLPKYIKIHPEIIENVRRTILEVARLKSNKFDGKQWAKEVTETFSKESQVDLDIDLKKIGHTIFVEDKVKKPKIPDLETGDIIVLSKKNKKPTKTFQEQLEELLSKMDFKNS